MSFKLSQNIISESETACNTTQLTTQIIIFLLEHLSSLSYKLKTNIFQFKTFIRNTRLRVIILCTSNSLCYNLNHFTFITYEII